MSEKINAIILCRVSTTRQATEGDSLADQEKLCREFCLKNGYNVVNVYKEDETGKIEDREALIKIKKEIADFKAKEGEKIHYLIFLKLDRLTRAGSGAYDNLKKELKSLGTELKDVWGIIQKGRQVIQDRHGVSFINKPWAYDSTPEISEQFQVSMAKIEGNTIIQRTQNSEVDLALLGYNTHKTPFGYKPGRTRDEKKLPIFEKDEIDAPCIKMIFDMRCKGKTDIQIKNRLKKKGYRTKPNNQGTGGRVFEVKDIQRMVLNTKYAGIIQAKWTGGRAIEIKGDPIVKIEEFNLANKGKIKIVYTGKYYEPLKLKVYDILYATNKSSNEFSEEKSSKKNTKNIENKTFPYTKLVYSTYGYKFLSGSEPKGKNDKVPYYHITIRFSEPELFRKGVEFPKSKKENPLGVYLGIRKEIFENTINDFLKQVQPLKPLEDLFVAYLQKLWDSKVSEEESTEKNGKKMITKLKNESQQIVDTIDSFIKYPTILQQKEKKLEEIEAMIQDLEAKENQSNSSEKEQTFDDFRKRGLYLLEHLGECFMKAENYKQRKLIFDIVFTRIPHYDEIVVGTPILSPLLAYISKNSQKKSKSFGVNPLWLLK